jgi:hypothetical protein
VRALVGERLALECLDDLLDLIRGLVLHDPKRPKSSVRNPRLARKGKGQTDLGWIDGERNSERLDVVYVQHGRVDDGDPREELRMGTGEHGDLSAPCCR